MNNKLYNIQLCRLIFLLTWHAAGKPERAVCVLNFLQLMWQLRISRAQMLPTADNDTVQHFRFSADAPRIAHYKATPSPEERVTGHHERAWKYHSDWDSTPGLPLDHQWYLYQKTSSVPSQQQLLMQLLLLMVCLPQFCLQCSLWLNGKDHIPRQRTARSYLSPVVQPRLVSTVTGFVSRGQSTNLIQPSSSVHTVSCSNACT